MKIVREVPKEYNVIQFDMGFVKKYGLIKYPMIEKSVVTEEKPYFKTVKRYDFLGKLFGIKETVKTYKEVKKVKYQMSTYPVTLYGFPLYRRWPEVHDGDWIVTDKKGISRVYTAKEFEERFTRK